MRNRLLLFVGFFVAVVAAAETVLHAQLLDLGVTWLQRVQDGGFVDLYSIWTYLYVAVLAVVARYAYVIFLKPLDRVRRLDDLGYACDGRQSMKDLAQSVQRNRDVGEVPPVYPNGWFSALESRDLETGSVKNVHCLGLNLAVFRGADGRAHVIDAYCPHLGANLAVGGRVHGNCLECPFHGWRFSGDDGSCTKIPYAEKNVARVKSYPCSEKNGFIYFWFHAEGAEPHWTPPDIEQVAKGEWAYSGRAEHLLNAHIEEVPENGADVAHLEVLHSPLMTAGIDIRYMFSKYWSFGAHVWHAEWAVNPAPEEHIGTLHLTHRLKLFGISLPFLDMNVTARQIGAGIVYMTFTNKYLGSGSFLQSLTPVEPMLLRMVHQCWHDRRFPLFVAKFFMLSEALMVERDIMIWNNKRYRKQPVLTRTPEDALLVRHRRWYSQFYSENSPKLKDVRKKSLDW